ncbi:hypothetical protein [Streptomyces sp. NPDC059224]|uniref:hypothetical protein n=1 Tax=Streptomyces sp. NPDC059224 TaxID=3346775 RepID=UPI0036AFAC28
MTDRIFTREQLEAWDLPGAWADDAPEILHREQVDTRRWVSVNELIFRAPDDGKAYRVYYDEGLTENQEDTDPWNDDREVKGAEVEQRPKTTMVWEDVRAAATPAEAPAKGAIPAEAAAHVLFQERLGGWPPSTFAAKLLNLWTSADTANADRLAAAFPEYAAAIALMRSGTAGIDQLRAIADGS